MTDAQIDRIRDIAPHWFEDYRDRSGAIDRNAMLDDARRWLAHSDPTDPAIAGWYQDINTDAAKAAQYLEAAA
jgi:hypothetical protein